MKRPSAFVRLHRPHTLWALAVVPGVLLLLSTLSAPLLAGPTTPRASATTEVTNPPKTSLSTAGDWPTYLEGPARTSANLAEKTISPSDAPNLQLLWSYQTRGPISASTVVVGDRAFVGSWDGWEYSFNSSDGALLWKTYLGLANTSACGSQGIASTATVQQGSLYVGGGDGNWYALNASTGNVEWKVLVGDPNQGYYNWASPLLFHGFAYVGVSSFCDKPLVPGGVLQINLSSHQIQNEFHTTPTGELGASVWGSPSVNTSTNTVYFATGNAGSHATGEMDVSIIAVNATTMGLVSSWKVNATEQIADGDFGSTPTLFPDSHGAPRAGALNKNGIFYVWNASRLSPGPVWQRVITTGQAVSSAAFGQGLVFVGAGTADFHGNFSSGAAWALKPATGAVAWEQPLWGKNLAAPAYANGIVAIDGGQNLFVLDATTGTKLWHFSCSSLFFASPSISHGRIFVGCSDGIEYAFGLLHPPLQIDSFDAIPSAIPLGDSTTFTPAVLGGTSPFTYAYTGLPPGCASADTPTLPCAPTRNGTFAVSVRVTDATRASVSATTTLVVSNIEGYAVTFVEAGLPSGTSWSTELAGNTNYSLTSSIVFDEPNGTYAFTVGAVAGYSPVPASGSVDVKGGSVTRPIEFSPTQPSPTISSFLAVPPQLILGGSATLEVTVSGGLAPLSYAYTQLPPGCATVNTPALPCTPTAIGGFTTEVEVNDSAGTHAFANATLTVLPVPMYLVEFTETGLPPGTTWAVVLNGTLASAATSTITFSEANGTYSFTILPISGFHALQYSGTVTVNGAGRSTPVSWSPVQYSVQFTESGLPSGSTWTVTMAGQSLSSPTASIAFSEKNGTHAFTVAAGPGYAANPSSGAVQIVGAAVNQPISFSAVPPPLISSFRASAASITLGEPITLTVDVSGGTPPFNYIYAGLPSGCGTQNLSSLTCTPTVTGPVTVTVTVRDLAGKFASAGTSFAVNAAPPSRGSATGPQFLGFPQTAGYIVLGLVLALAVIVVAILVTLASGRRPERPSPRPRDPSSSQHAPTRPPWRR